MPHATGTRILAGFCIGISFIPPWVQAVVTLPLGVAFWYKAREKEKERERELEALEQ